MATCSYCGGGPLVTDHDVCATVCSSCGRQNSTDLFISDVPSTSAPTELLSADFTYRDRKIHRAKTLVSDLLSRLGLSSRFHETLSLLSHITDGNFGAGDWFDVLTAAAAYVVSRRHGLSLSMHRAAAEAGCDGRQIGRMVLRVMRFLDGETVPQFDATGALDWAIGTCSSFTKIDDEKKNELIAMGRFLIQCMMKWFLMTGRRPLPAVAAVATFVAEVNGIEVEIEEIAKEIYAVISTSRLRLRELKETLVKVAMALLPWGKDVNLKNLVHNMPVLVRVMETKAKLAKKKSSEGVEFNLDEYLTMYENANEEEGSNYYKIGRCEGGVSCDELDGVEISGERLSNAYKNVLDQIADVRDSGGLNDNTQGRKKRTRRQLEAEGLWDFWEGRWDLGKKLSFEQVLDRDVGYEALPPSFVSGIERRERRKVKIEAAKRRINQITNAISTANVTLGQEDNRLLKPTGGKKQRKRVVGINGVDWEDCIIELLLLHRVDEGEIEQGQYNRLLDLHVFNSDIAHNLQSLGVLLCDGSGHFNLAFRMTKAGFSDLQEEASWTLSCTDKCRDGAFEEIFLTKVDFAAKFDSCLRLNMKGNVKANAQDFCLDDECWRVCEKDVHSHLQQGLSDRAKLVRVAWSSTPSTWNLEDGFSKFGNEPMLVGILASSHEKSFRVVDVGPSVNDKEEGVKFRKFWGEKAELRRFRDGTIAESTIWECEPWEKHLIIKRITEYILTRHFLLSKEDMVHIVNQLDFCLQLSGKDPISFSGALLGALEILSKRLRLLDEIPLKISSVQPLDPAFRHTSVFPPAPHPLVFEKGKKKIPNFATTCVQPIEVMIQLEGSGNWPLDIAAIKKTKSAFLLKIGESLQNRWGMFCTATEDVVDVFTSGYAFRLKILHERGLNLVRGQDGNNKGRNVASIDKELFLRSQHSSMINGLQGRYPLYGPVVRLAKRWVSSHLFSSFLTEEAIELVVAYLFLRPFPFHAPCSRVTGFLRFLRLLSNYNWTFSPLIVDINDDFTSKDEKEISDNFILSRISYEGNAQDVMPAMFLAPTYDRASEAWTKFTPTRSVLKRMASYAQCSADLLTNMILQSQTGSFTWECIFRTPLNNYDAVVLLHQDKLSYPQRLLFPAEVNQGKHVIWGKASRDFNPYMVLGNAFKSLEDARNNLLMDFDPTKYFLEDLKEQFPDTFKVWYDSFGGDAIGLTWQKKVSKKRNRDESNEFSEEPIKLLKDVGEVGKGFVKSVYLLKAPKLHG